MALQQRDETRGADKEAEVEGRKLSNISNKHNSEETRTLHLQLPNKSSPRTPDWEQFSNWVHCICIVTFDLELGQAIEVNIVMHALACCDGVVDEVRWMFCNRALIEEDRAKKSFNERWAFFQYLP